MTLENKKTPSRGRLFKLFTDLGPYFRKQQSTESSFFFDCLEICLDAEKEPEDRVFYGWWFILEKEEDSFKYTRFNGLYNLQGDWVAEALSESHQAQVDDSFEVFVKRLETLIEGETGLKLKAKQVDLVEV